MKKDGKNEKKSNRRRRHPAATVLSGLGTFLLLALILACLPLTVPRLFGYHIYSVVSGSMEPAISTGSLVYIGETEPKDVSEGEVIAFYGARDSASIITHRVVENRVVMGELITKGDANQTNDMNPVPYANVIGEVACHIPAAGKAAEVFTSMEGKLLAGGLIGAAILLQVLAVVVERRF